MRDLLPAHRPALVLAPMQAITDLPFMRVLARRSLPDWFVCEYFRVHPASSLNPHILRTITENNTGRPVFAQLIGSDLVSLRRIAAMLEGYPVAGIDLNLGCPAPIVCRKAAGGALLRDLESLNRLLGGLREAISGCFTVKTRVGYIGSDEFAGLLGIFRRHAIDGLTIHARSVHERYHGPVHTDCVLAAVSTLSCPVIANGNIVDVPSGLAYQRRSRAAGLMIGRGAIRNPWIFGQLRAAYEGGELIIPTYRDLLSYVRDLSEEIAREAPRYEPLGHVQRMKRTLGYISHGLDPVFEYAMRRCVRPEEMWAICEAHLASDEALPSRPPEDSKLFSGFAQLTEDG